jgi:hypothetical protein
LGDPAPENPAFVLRANPAGSLTATTGEGNSSDLEDDSEEEAKTEVGEEGWPTSSDRTQDRGAPQRGGSGEEDETIEWEDVPIGSASRARSSSGLSMAHAEVAREIEITLLKQEAEAEREKERRDIEDINKYDEPDDGTLEIPWLSQPSQPSRGTPIPGRVIRPIRGRIANRTLFGNPSRDGKLIIPLHSIMLTVGIGTLPARRVTPAFTTPTIGSSGLLPAAELEERVGVGEKKPDEKSKADEPPKDA